MSDPTAEGANPPQETEDLAKLEHIPVSFQELTDYFSTLKIIQPAPLRQETFRRIESVTGRPLICYVCKTHNVPYAAVPADINDSDLTGFSDLIFSVEGDAVDVFLVSNGGSAEATERIVRLLRERFTAIRFIIPGNAYSAATLLCFSGDEIIMGPQSTLGPIDPQINGVPARAILRAFDNVKEILKEEGPAALTAYMPLLANYTLYLLEICRSAQELSKELARVWLSTYMLNCDENDKIVSRIVDFFSDYDIHKSHGRGIDRKKAQELKLKVTNAESIGGLADLLRSLYNQYEYWFDQTGFYKVFENAHGIGWGRQAQTVTLQLPLTPTPTPQPGPPERSG